MPAAVTPCLMFEGQAQQAMEFYTRILPDSEILNIETYGSVGPGPGEVVVSD